MPRKLNGKLTCWLFGTLVLGTAGIHALHEFQMRRHADAWLTQARRAKQQGETGQCLNYLARYLTYRPTDADTLAEYGLLLEQVARSPREHREATRALEKTLAYRPERNDVRACLARAALQSGQIAAARDHLTILLKSAPESIDFALLYGQCLEASREYEPASAWYEKSIERHPDQVALYLRLVHLWQYRLDDPAQATQVLDRLVAANQHSAPAFLARALYHQEHGASDEALQNLERARQLTPTDPDVLLMEATLEPTVGGLEEARTHLREGLKVQPRHAGLCRALAELELRAGNSADAVACLRQGLQAVPEQPDLLAFLCDLLIQRGELAEAEEIISRLRRAGNLPARAGYWDARVRMRQGRWAEAVHLLHGARESLMAPKWAALVCVALGDCAGELGDPDRQRSEYRRAVAADPSSVAARVKLGNALLVAGQASESVTEFRQLVKLTLSSGDSWRLLAQALLARNLQVAPERREWQEVDQALERAARGHGDDMRLLLLRADVLAAQAKGDEARSMLEQARQRYPRDIRLWIALVVLLDQQGQWEDALKVIDHARQEWGDSVELLVARLSCLARHGEPIGRAVLELQNDLAKLPVEEQSRLRRQLAETCARSGEWAAAQGLIRQTTVRAPDDLRNRLFLFDLYLAAGQHAPLPQLLAEMRHIEGDEGTHWRLGEVVRRVRRLQPGDEEELRQVRQQLAEVARRRPDWSPVSALEAELAETEGKPEQAIRLYQRALELGERRPPLVGRLTQLLYERRRFTEADEALRMLDDAAVSGPLARLAAETALANGNRTRAVEWARRAVSDRDFRTHLWLARIQEGAGQGEAAEKTLRTTLERTGGIPDTWVALVQHLARTGKNDEADTVLQEMAAALSPEQLPLALADCYAALSRRVLAEGKYQAALADRPDDFIVLQKAATFYLEGRQSAKAIPLLRRLLRAEVEAPADQAAWGRRELALALADKGTDGDFRDALALLDKCDTVEDRRTRARVLATQPEHWATALRLLEGTLEGRPLKAEEEYLLARLYDTAGNQNKANEHFLHLLTTHGDNPQYLADYVRQRLRAGEVSEARQWFTRLERLEPQAARTQEIKAELAKAAE